MHSSPYVLQTFHTEIHGVVIFIVKLLVFLSNCVSFLYIPFHHEQLTGSKTDFGKVCFTQTWCLGKSVLDISKCNNDILQSSRKKDGGTFCGF